MRPKDLWAGSDMSEGMGMVVGSRGADDLAHCAGFFPASTETNEAAIL